MASEERTPADIVVNGSLTGLLPSPPSTISSVVTPGRPTSPRPPRTNTKKKKWQQSTMLSPRPARDLLVERCYLVGSLAAQGARASELIQRLSVAEQAAAAGEGGRRLRKHIALLEGRIAAAAEQEKAVIVRLGELYVEMQSRERWARARARAQAHVQAFQEGCFPVMPPGPGVPAAVEAPVWEMSFSTELSPLVSVPVAAEPELEVSKRTGLNPLSPEFVPTWRLGGNTWPMTDVPVPPEQ